MTSAPSPLAHLDQLSDFRGLQEHAEGTVPRVEHGYCTDDNARLLIVASREPDVGAAHRLSRLSLQFVCNAQDAEGRSHNRLSPEGRWLDQADTEDCWGRGLWGLGVAAAHHSNPTVRRWAARGFDRGARQRSPHTRAMVFAALGAAEVVTVDRANKGARRILERVLEAVGPVPAGSWGWPEPRLRYANAAVAEAVIAAGSALHRLAAVERGLSMLGWLLETETRDGRLSVTGVDGRGPGETEAQFDQQPIEVAAMADACARAYTLTGDERWARGVEMAAAWFEGDNDIGLVMFDPDTGGGYDGLHRDRVNLNQGAESGLAYVSTVQRAQAFARAA